MNKEASYCESCGCTTRGTVARDYIWCDSCGMIKRKVTVMADYLLPSEYIEVPSDGYESVAEPIRTNIRNYIKTCREKNYPKFMPTWGGNDPSLHGTCRDCSKQLFDKPMHFAETGCRFCHRSYCD